MSTELPYIHLIRSDDFDGAGVVPGGDQKHRFPTTGACMTFLHNITARTLDAVPGSFVYMTLEGTDLKYECATEEEYLFTAYLCVPASVLPPLVAPKKKPRVIRKATTTRRK